MPWSPSGPGTEDKDQQMLVPGHLDKKIKITKIRKMTEITVDKRRRPDTF